MHRRTHKQLLSDLTAALDFCSSLGVEARNTRYGRYEKWLGILVKDVRAGGPSEHWNQAEILNAIHESSEFAEQCVPFLRTLDPDVARAKVKKIARGPDHAKDEGAARTTNDARNHLFEILLAAHIAGGKLLPRLEEPDLVVPVTEGHLLLACKRPMNVAGVEDAARRARDQIRASQLTRGDEGIGIAAISLTRVGLPGVARVGTRGWDEPLSEAAVTERATAELAVIYRDHVAPKIGGDLVVATTVLQ